MVSEFYLSKAVTKKKSTECLYNNLNELNPPELYTKNG